MFLKCHYHLVVFQLLRRFVKEKYVYETFRTLYRCNFCAFAISNEGPGLRLSNIGFRVISLDSLFALLSKLEKFARTLFCFQSQN